MTDSRNLSWDEFRQRLRGAGWSEEEIEKEIRSIMEDEESDL